MIGTIILYWIQFNILGVWTKEDSKPDDWFIFCPISNIICFGMLFLTTIYDYIHPPHWCGLYQKRNKTNI